MKFKNQMRKQVIMKSPLTFFDSPDLIRSLWADYYIIKDVDPGSWSRDSRKQPKQVIDSHSTQSRCFGASQ